MSKSFLVEGRVKTTPDLMRQIRLQKQEALPNLTQLAPEGSGPTRGHTPRPHWGSGRRAARLRTSGRSRAPAIVERPHYQ